MNRWTRKDRAAFVAIVAAIGLAPAIAARAADPVGEAAVHGLLQTWGTVVDQDEDPQADPAGPGDPEADPGVSIHRARVGLDGTRGGLSWDLTVGYGEPYDRPDAFGGETDFGFIDAWGGWTFGLNPEKSPAFTLSAGLQKVPFLREELMSSADLTFQERSVSSQRMSVGRQVGLLADLRLGSGLGARVGVYNGNGALSGDDNVGKLIVGRLEWGTGDTYRTWSPTGENAAGLAASVKSDTAPGTETLGLNVDALFRLKRVTALFQVTREDEGPRNADVIDPDLLERTIRQGAFAQFSYFQPLGTETNGDRGVEIAARAALLDSWTRQSDNGDVGIFHLGATYRDVVPGLDLGGGVIRREELGGATIANDTVRLWAQVRTRHDVSGGGEQSTSIMTAWRTDFVGTWKAGGDLEGAVIALWEQPGLGLVGSFQMQKPKGTVIVGRPYPLDSFMYADRTLRVRMDPYGEGRDVVWFELSPSQDGQLCGYGYEDGRRSDAVGGTGGGSWICWSEGHGEAAASTTAVTPTSSEP